MAVCAGILPISSRLTCAAAHRGSAVTFAPAAPAAPAVAGGAVAADSRVLLCRIWPWLGSVARPRECSRRRHISRSEIAFIGSLKMGSKMLNLDIHAQVREQQGREATAIISKVTVSGSDDAKFRKELFPQFNTNQTGFLKVSDLHSLYWEESGNPTGQPMIFLHGGPGAGTSAGNRRYFDPEHYRIILLDQRGAGKSTPHACTKENTTWDLVNDIEKLREHLGIERWMVFGGSWGSTLALTYAETHPEKVTGIVLRGIFLLRKKEIDWFYQSGTSSIFPDAWESYRDFIPEDERHDFLSAYSKRLNSDDRAVQLAAAKAWTNWEMATSYLVPNIESLRRGENDKFAMAFAQVENHYFMNKGFLPTDSYILDNVHKIRHIPAVIVQGRYDVVCPMMSAWDLHKAWPEAKFKVVGTAGHSANEVGISAELVGATEFLKSITPKDT